MEKMPGVCLGSQGPPDGDTCLPQRRGARGQRHLRQVFPDLAQTPVFKIGLRKGNDLPKVRESGPGAAAGPPGGCSPLLPGSPCSALSPRNQSQATWHWPPHWTTGEMTTCSSPRRPPAEHPPFPRRHGSLELGGTRGISELSVTMHRRAPRGGCAPQGRSQAATETCPL